MDTKGLTFGERLNNPLNIRRVRGQLWKGEEALPQKGSGEGAFCKFSSLEWGIRAAFCLLRTYQNKYKAVCIEDIISRWAPPTENDTRKYICDLCRLTGFGGRERLTEEQWPRLVRAMALIESGAVLSEETIEQGYKLYKNTNA